MSHDKQGPRDTAETFIGNVADESFDTGDVPVVEDWQCTYICSTLLRSADRDLQAP